MQNTGAGPKMSVTTRTKLKNVTRTFLSICVGLTFASHAEEVTFIGKVKTELPKVTVTNSNDPVSDVKQFSLSVSPSAGVCNIQANPDDAKKHGSTPLCLITWDDPKGLESYLRGLKGVVKGAGEHTFTYKLSMFDKDKFDLISEHQYSVTFNQPIAPDAPTISSSWVIKPDTTETEHLIFNRNESHKTVSFSLTPRNYDQKIEFGEHSCVIPEGARNCTIVVNSDYAESEQQGSAIAQFRSTDTYGHFDQPKTDFKYVWDFRPPIIHGVHVNSKDDLLPQVITDYGQTLVLMHDQAAIVVKSPHTNIEEDWWLPTDPSLKIVPNKELNITNQLSINNVNVLFNVGSTIQNAYQARPIAKPQRLGEYIAYVYDFSEINDGLYNFQFSTIDKNGNGEEKTIPEIYIDRTPPDLQFVVNNKQHKTRMAAHAYSISDITVAAWGGWEDGSEIISAKLNDEPIDFAGGTNLVKRFKNVEMPLGSLNTLEVLAKDKSGNEVSKKLDFKYGIYSFNTYATDAIAQVQEAKVYLENVKGAPCIAATSPELASIYSQLSTSLKRGCTIEWIEKPNGLNVDNFKNITTKTILVAGGVIPTAGEHPYSFKVLQYDAFGQSKSVYEASGIVNVAPLTAPELIVGMTHIANNFPETYKYKLPAERRLNIPAFVTYAKGADVLVELRDSESNVLETRSLNKVRSSSNVSFTLPNTFPNLSTGHYLVRTYYTANPSIYSEKPYHYFVTPSSMMRLSLKHPQVAVQGATLPIKAQIGESTDKGIVYASSQGEWEIHLEKLDPETNKLIPISEKVLTNAQGEADLSISADELQLSNNRVFAIANLKTPYPEVAMSLRASSLFSVPVLTTGSISVQLSANAIRNPAPANFLVRMSFETKADSESTESISWQESVDGNTWTPVSKSTNVDSLFVTLPTAQERYIRAQIKHKLSTDNKYTNVIKLTAYDEAVLTLSGDQTVIPGAIGRYYFELNDFALNNAQGSVEWSLDNGQTWQPMAPSDEAVIEDVVDIKARLLVKSGEDAPYYITDSLTVSPIDPTPLRPSITVSDRRAEIGDTITMSARFATSQKEFEKYYRYHYVTPTGEIVNELNLSKVLAQNDFANGTAVFLFRSWFEGIQLQTISTKQIPISQIIYQFPETGLTVFNKDRIVNTPINVGYIKPLKTSLPKRVVLSQELSLPPTLELVRSTDSTVTLKANATGLHPISVRFFDNRGNEAEHTAFIEAHDPPPMSLNLTTHLQGEHIRPPIRLVSRMVANPGSPLDKLKTVKWELNDKVVSEEIASTFRTIIEEPGTYKLKLNVETEYGQTAERTFDFVVSPNKKPYCEPFWETRDTSYTFNANCKDDDGKILLVNIAFYITDEEQRDLSRYYSHQVTFMKDAQPTNKPLEVKVLDDSFDEIAFQFPWPNAE